MEKGKTIKQIADECGVSEQAVRAWSCKRSLSGGLENLFRTGYNNN